MRRLREEAPTNALVGPAIDAVRAVPATVVNSDVRRRVWAALQTSAASRHRHAGGALPRLRWFALTLVLICVAGTASAVMGHRWIEAIVSRLRTPAAAPATAPGPSLPRPQPLARAASRPKEIEPPAVEVAAAPAAPTSPPGAVGPTGHAWRAHRPFARTAVPGTRPAPDPAAASVAAASAASIGRSEVLDAMVALRRDRDPVTAGQLLARYLTAHPQGALREEALVLSIEAAAARHDRAAVGQLAHQYRTSYPHGRFQAFVASQLTSDDW